jgi:TrmH family RNA methyltransferase
MAQITPLPSAKAALIRKLLRDKKVRDSEGAFVLEGEKPIRELLMDPGIQLRILVLTPTYVKRAEQRLLKALTDHPAATHLCPETLFRRLSDVRASQGILAVIAKPRWNEARVLTREQVFGVYGEQLQDPTNVGTLIRTAAAFDVDGLWFSTDSTDPFNPKVVRATAGALLKLPIFSVADPSRFKQQHCAVLATQASGRKGQDIRTITRIPRRAVLALGNESRGLSEATLKQATVRFHVPIGRQVESLNVAAAAAICLFYLSGLPRVE